MKLFPSRLTWKSCPRPPRWLDGEGAAEWKRLARTLWKDGRLDKLSYTPFAMYCSAVGHYREYADQVEREGRMLRTSEGIEYPHPLADAAAAWLGLAREAAAGFYLDGPEGLKPLPTRLGEEGED